MFKRYFEKLNVEKEALEIKSNKENSIKKKFSKQEQQEARAFYLNLFKEVSKFPNTLEVGYFKAKGFDINKKLDRVRGLFVEVGGPTSGGYALIDTDELPKKMYTSNVNVYKNEAVSDFIADAKNMPLTNNSVGALFAAHLSIENADFKKFINEALRIIEPGGILIFEGGSSIVFETAKEAGFSVVLYSVQSGRDNIYCRFIFEKPQELQEKN